MGARLHLGPIPREEFLDFLDKGFRTLRPNPDRSALEHILERGAPPVRARLVHDAEGARVVVAPGTGSAGALRPSGVAQALDERVEAFACRASVVAVACKIAIMTLLWPSS
jgi:hypothetical protein